ncbi:hypothetical protein ABI052_14780, partial [Enterococcus faecium]|uniref:hypothetical protein n=1 Tax=Enterococcus faecium TaxID=1352 RepID=UPI003F431F71
DNYGVLPLPNLETKFVAANTLIGLKKKKQGDFVNTLFDNDEITLVKAQIFDIRHKHFYARSVSEKKRLREKDAEQRTKLIELLDIHGGDNASD